MSSAISKLGGIIGNLMVKEGNANPLLASVLSFMSNGLTFAANAVEAESDEARKYVHASARTFLNYEFALRKAVDASATPWDNLILDELVEACKEIEPGYVAVS